MSGQSRRLQVRLLLAGILLTVCPWLDRACAVDNAVECAVDLDQAVRFANESQRAIVKVALRGNKSLQRPAINLAIALDRSGSMTGDKLDKAKDAAIAALRKLGPQDMFSLVTYAQTVNVDVPSQLATNLAEIEAKIRQIAPTKGNTALFGGLSLAAHEVRRNPDTRFVRRIILLSDGRANAGPSSTADLRRLGHALRKEGISVSTIGLGTDFNEDLMTALSEESDGHSYFAKSSEDLPRIFTVELGEVMNVVAKSAMLSIDFLNGVTPIGVVGRDGTISGNNVKLELNNLYSGEERDALVEVMLPASNATGQLEVATATVTLTNAISLAAEEVSAKGHVRFSNREEDVKKSANVAVQNRYFNNLRAAAQDQAVLLADNGKNAAAAEQLRGNGETLRWNGVVNNDAQLIAAADELEKQAEEIQRNGMSAQARKALRIESFQTEQGQMAR